MRDILALKINMLIVKKEYMLVSKVAGSKLNRHRRLDGQTEIENFPTLKLVAMAARLFHLPDEWLALDTPP